jgi:hypothetical protein
MMMSKVYALTTCLMIFIGAAFPPSTAIAAIGNTQKSDKALLGNFANGKYAFPGDKIRVKAPPLLEPGAKIRDEKSTQVIQVVFTDDLGAFYRVIVLDNSGGEFKLDDVLSTFDGLREKQMIETSRGQEIRAIDLEKEGAEITLTSTIKDEAGKPKTEQKTPDLLTANAAFVKNTSIIHVVAGMPVLDPAKVETLTVTVKERLDKFLAGLELVDEKSK